MIEPNTQHNFTYNTVSYTASAQYKNAMTPSIYSCRSIWLIHGVQKNKQTHKINLKNVERIEKQKKKPAAPAIPRRSPIQVLSWPDVA